MTQSVVTRTQRRVERKQALWIILLVLGVSVASFALGYSLGKRGEGMSGLGQDTEKPRLPMATQVVPPPPPEPEEKTEPQKLTFYDNLPKGAQAPLGSGINLPPTPETPVEKEPAPKVTTAPPKPASVPSKPLEAPKVAPAGAFVVQVASFRAEEDAKKLIARLQKLQLGAFVERADLGDKGVWYRVLAGPYGEREVADKVAGRLQSEERLSALVRRR